MKSKQYTIHLKALSGIASAAGDGVKKYFYRKKRVYTIAAISFVIACMLFFLVINIAASQAVPKEYFGLVNNDRNAVVSYLKKIRQLPQFSAELKQYENLDGSDIEQDVFQAELERKEKIKVLERLLEKNPKVPEILYTLSQFYREDGNDAKAQEYLKRAREIDPEIGR